MHAVQLWHWYSGYSEPVKEGEPPPPAPPAGAVALCGHVREDGLPDVARDMRKVDEASCLKCVRLRLGDVAEDFTDAELLEELRENS